MAIFVTKTQSGLLLREDFSAPSGWTGSGSNWSVGSNPGFVSFGTGVGVPSGTRIVLPLPATGQPNPNADGGGMREVSFYVEGNTWYLYYVAGDGTAGSASSAVPGNWRPQYATSTDRGVTWTKHGYLMDSSGLASGGSEGTVIARDLGQVVKIGSTYVLEVFWSTTATTISGGGAYVSIPFVTDIWTASSPAGPWTYGSGVIPLGSAGTFDEAATYASCMVSDGTTSWIFYGSGYSPYVSNNVGLATTSASTPGAQYAKYPNSTGGALFPGGVSSSPGVDYAENPKVWYWPVLSCWVMTLNGQIPLQGHATNVNLYYLNNQYSSTSIPTSWATLVDGPVVFQYINPSTGGTTCDGSNALGVISPFYQPDNGKPVIDPNGYIPAIYDAFAPVHATTNDNAAIDHKLVYTVLEPSAYALTYGWTSGTDSDVFRYKKSLSHGDFVAEFAVDYSAKASGGVIGVGFDYRIQSSGDSYRVILSPGAGLTLYKSAGGSGGNPGTYNQLATSSAVNVAIVNQTARILISVSGNNHVLYLDGEQQVNYTDNSFPYTSGIAIAFVAGGMHARFRLLHVRTGSSVTISGMRAGETLTFRAPGGIPVETATTSGSSYTTLAVNHYPIDSFTYAGVDVPFTNSGLLWGGDSLSLQDVAIGAPKIS